MDTKEMDNKKLAPPMEYYPEFVHEALQQNGLYSRFTVRPVYQQINYLKWINSAQKSETKLKRLDQMLSELRSGDKYMSLPFSEETGSSDHVK
jgi:uncharacterized protein YdeI (YjbR/CyaY-like superfamily)